MAKLIDWQALQAIDNGSSQLIAISNLQALFLQACSSFYNNRYVWVYGPNDVTDEQWDAINMMVSDTELALMSNMVGMILPNVLASISGMPVLACNGVTYLRTDYPLLYAAIDTAYIVDANNFRVPNLTDKFARGASMASPIGTTGGDETVVLTEAQLASHSHTSPPHVHGYDSAFSSTVLVNAGAPVPAAIPLPKVTGDTAVSISSTGSNEPHNNVPPFESISYVIVAG